MTKAVIFTHINVKATSLIDPAGFDTFYGKYGALFESCLACKNIALVFAYFSYGIEEYVASALSNPALPVAFPLNVIEGEQRIFNALSMAVDKALDNLSHPGAHFSTTKAPRFVFVGVRELANLLHRLWLRNPQLVTYLAGQGTFTYDSPKFVEAVIRLARGSTDEARHPILRIDADVELNTDAVQLIIDQVEILHKDHNNPYWWFSGCYSGNFKNDYVNEHAVRMHWLVDPKTWNSPEKFALLPRAETFLRDLAEFGATQVEASVNCSTSCESTIGRRGASLSRQCPQVISGAGLVASVAAIRRLPPFMNAQNMIVWIDDHLKRQLHEAIGDIPPGSPERIKDARFRQDRHPAPLGILKSDIEWAKSSYFNRLLRGCLMQATIKDTDGHAGALARWVKQVVLGVRKELPPADEVTLRGELRDAALTRFDEVMEVWREADYGNDVLKRWTESFTPSDRDVVCSNIADVGVSYLRLLFLWNEYVWAIQDLGRLEAYWLFTRVRP